MDSVLTLLNEHATILAIESSCDDTSAAVIKDGSIRSNVVSSQLIHAPYGGVVPELASRAHQQMIVPVCEAALKKANVHYQHLNAIAYTAGPGLLGSLLVGSSFAKGLAISLNLPLIAVDHMKAHVAAHFIDEPKPTFPFLCLLVSGGHTRLVLLRSENEQEIIGETKDDAAGEAFDKAAKMLGIPYPGGPLIDRYAKSGNPTRFKFNTAQMTGYDYSFSGLKTSILYFLQDQVLKQSSFIQDNLPDLCASIQFTIVNYLLKNLRLAAEQYQIKNIGLAGGVAANSELRRSIQSWCMASDRQAFIPDFQYCTDNAGMIAMEAYRLYKLNSLVNLETKPYAR